MSSILDLDGPLDYEPDGLDVDEYSPGFIEKDQIVSNRHSDDDRKPIYEPNGNDDQSSSKNASFEGYSLDTELAQDVPGSYRESINYNDLHIDVEEDSYRNKFGKYSIANESVYLDSSDDEARLSDTEDQDLVNELETEEQISHSASTYDNNEYYQDSNYIAPETPDEDKSTDQCFKLSEKSGSITSTLFAYHNEDMTEFDRTTNNNINKFYEKKNSELITNGLVSLPKKKPLNFSIKVVGNERLCLIPKSNQKVVTRRCKKPWLNKASNYLKSDLVRVCSKDEIVRCPPDFIPKSDISSPISDLRNYLGETSCESPMSGTSYSSLFKVPLKRPPTRQTSNKNISVSVDLISRQKTVIPAGKLSPLLDVDDAISLIASCQLSTDDIGGREAQQNNVTIKQEELSLAGISTDTEVAKKQRTAQWVSHGFDEKGYNVSLIPDIYKGLCYNYFFRNNCSKKICRMSHWLDVPRTKIRGLKHLDLEELNVAYNFAKEYPFFFGLIYKYFAEAFALKDLKFELISLVHIIFEETSHRIDLQEGLTTVINALQQTDLSTFEDSVEYVLMQIGLNKYAELGQILLQIILSKPNQPCYWPIVKKLFIAGVKMNDKMGAKYLIHVMKSPVDIKVCLDLHQHLRKYNSIDLSRIPEDIRNMFLKLCSNPNIAGEMELQEKIAQNLRKERYNVENRFSTESNTLNQGTANGVMKLPVFNSPLASLQRATLTARTNSGATSYPSQEFGSISSSALDFASLSRHDAAFAPQNTETKFTSSIFERPRCPPNRDNMDENSSHSSASGPLYNQSKPRSGVSDRRSRSSREDRSSKSADSAVYDASPYFQTTLPTLNARKRPQEATGLTYNKEGLQYDPAIDYAPLSKRITLGSPHDVDLRVNNHIGAGLDRSTPPIDIFALREAAQSKRKEGKVVSKPLNNLDLELRRKKLNGATNRSFRANLLDKCPEHPQFGKLHLNECYEFNVSLHNLYLQPIDNVDIDEEDIHRLNDCVKYADGKTFLLMIDKYSNPKTVQNFISMTLAHLKGMNQLVDKTYKKLLENIEKESPNFHENRVVRAILEVVTMNLLFHLHKRGSLDTACYLLNKFSDWDSLITSRLFINVDKGISIVGRYLFIAQILTHTKPELTYEILTCPAFRLLENCNVWPYHLDCPIPEIFIADLETRNRVIDEFLKIGYRRNAVAVIQLYKTAFRKEIWKYDVKPFVDQMVVSLLKEKNIVSLKQISNEIDIFYKHMSKDTLKAFLVTMYEHLSQSDLYDLYEKCVEKRIYQKLLCGEMIQYNVEIKTNMKYEEMEVIIKYYFSKLAEIKKVPPGSEPLKFEIKLPGESNSRILQSVHKSVIQIKEELQQILKSISVESRILYTNFVEVDKAELVKYLESLWT